MSLPVIPDDGNVDPSALYAVPGQKLIDIADQIRLKRDIATLLTVDEMPLQIGLIESGGSDGYSIHEVEFDSPGGNQGNFVYNIKPKYIGECYWFYFYPLEETNTATGTICIGYSAIPDLPTSPTGVKLLSPVQYYINDVSYNSIRMRGNIPGIPVGRYKLVWYGTAK